MHLKEDRGQAAATQSKNNTHKVEFSHDLNLFKFTKKHK